MAAICPSCGSENPDGFAFCGRCGAKIEAAAPALEQRRLCTIVFCDLVGFTQRSESLDPEDVRQFLLPYYELMTEEVERYGGTIDKLYGDGAMAVFGVPTAHEDDPERAIRASLRVLERLPSLGLDLEARIGINTGEVVVSTDHAARGDALTGDTVNTASRVQGAAPVGGVVVGERTYQDTKHVFDYAVLEPVALKGKAEPVAIYHPTAPIAVVEVRAAEPTPFVGRDRELAALVAAFERARGGEPTFLTIVAEPGLGKSRLVREFERHVDDLPELVTWRQGRCLPYGEGISFWALGEIVKTHAGILETDDQATISQKLDTIITEPDHVTRGWIKDRLAPLAGLESTTTAPERGELFAAWRRFFVDIADKDPLVLLIEDLHWADDVLVAFLQELRQHLVGVPILVLATARPEVAERHPSWLDGSELRLDALDDAAMHELVAMTLSDAAPELVDTVCERAGGSPLYAEQLAAMRRAMPIAGGSEDDLPIPPTIHALLSARIDMLPDELLSTLLDASVVGKTFWPGAVATLGETDTATAEDRLGQLAQREFIRSDDSSTIEGEREYAFVHALMHDVAYGRLSRRPRFAKHRATAAWITEVVGRPLGPVADIVVTHLDQAGEAARAAGLDDEMAALDSALADALIDAATNAERTDIPTAVRLIERALPLVAGDDPRRPAVLYDAANYVGGMGDMTRALELLDASIPTLRAAENWDDLGDALKSRAATLLNLGHEDAAEAARREAVEEMAPHPGRGLVAVLTEDVWQEASYGRPEEYRPHLERAEQAADDADIAPPHRLLEIRGGMEITTGDVETGLRHIREAAERALADGEATVAASILNDLGSVSHRYATMEAAIAACDEAIAITQERGLDPMIGPGPRTSALMHLGRWDEVVAETPRLIQIASERGNLFMAEGLWIPLARVLLDRGEPELIEEELFEPERFSMRSDARSWAIHVRLHVPRGDIDLEPMRALIEADEMIPMPMLMETLIEIDAIDLAEAFRRSFIGRPMEEPWVDGLLSEGRGEWHEAQQAFETTLEYFRRVGSVFIEADLQARIGRCALELGDLATARERLTRSRELWVGMRANARIADVDALLARL